MQQFDFNAFMDSYMPSIMNVAIKQIYGIVIWISGIMTLLFMALDVPAVRTNICKVPMWPVYGIEYLARLTGKKKRNLRKKKKIIVKRMVSVKKNI